MQKSFLLYATIISVLLSVFTYMYYSKEMAFTNAQNEKYTKRYQDSLSTMKSQLAEANYFSLERNDNAQNYFEAMQQDKFIAYEKLIPYVTEKLLDYNQDPKGNPYTGQDQFGPQKFIINKVKVINHRWIIADYSDGQYWGEVLLKYFVNEDESISFEIIQSVLYQK
ncbi:MAG: hypothetical protein KA325_00900 [Flavobacterium sp.]|nr:hypothetical protein [Flavobacterium sp.]